MGGATHMEYWIPAEDSVEFDASIALLIEVIEEL
jgi:hypothetical protein